MVKRTSIVTVVILGGAAALAGFGTGFFAELQSMAASQGMDISGPRLIVVLIALSAAASLSPTFGAKYRGFLGRHGLKP